MHKNMATRVLSLDVFRGITIVLMIVVNSPGNQFAYAWLEHSTWNGCTLADLVFPFFMVIVGISSVLALVNLKIKGVPRAALFALIIKRATYIFFTGLILNILPNHFDFSHLRFLGVLQRIALGYFFASILFLTTAIRTQGMIIVILLIGYWALMAHFSDISSLSLEHNLVGYLDQQILSP